MPSEETLYARGMYGRKVIDHRDVWVAARCFPEWVFLTSILDLDSSVPALQIKRQRLFPVVSEPTVCGRMSGDPSESPRLLQPS
jgi:hypothetical protein